MTKLYELNKETGQISFSSNEQFREFMKVCSLQKQAQEQEHKYLEACDGVRYIQEQVRESIAAPAEPEKIIKDQELGGL